MAGENHLLPYRPRSTGRDATIKLRNHKDLDRLPPEREMIGERTKSGPQMRRRSALRGPGRAHASRRRFPASMEIGRKARQPSGLHRKGTTQGPA